MRNKIFIILITVVILLTFSLISCGKQADATTIAQNITTTQTETSISEKQYTVTIYTLNDKGKKTVDFAKNEVGWTEEETIKKVLDGKTEYTPSDLFKIDVYSAKEIIDYSDKNVRFVNVETNLEEFLTADYIKIEQIK